MTPLTPPIRLCDLARYAEPRLPPRRIVPVPSCASWSEEEGGSLLSRKAWKARKAHRECANTCCQAEVLCFLFESGGAWALKALRAELRRSGSLTVLVRRLGVRAAAGGSPLGALLLHGNAAALQVLQEVALQLGGPWGFRLLAEAPVWDETTAMDCAVAYASGLIGELARAGAPVCYPHFQQLLWTLGFVRSGRAPLVVDRGTDPGAFDLFVPRLVDRGPDRGPLGLLVGSAGVSAELAGLLLANMGDYGWAGGLPSVFRAEVGARLRGHLQWEEVRVAWISAVVRAPRRGLI